MDCAYRNARHENGRCTPGDVPLEPCIQSCRAHVLQAQAGVVAAAAAQQQAQAKPHILGRYSALKMQTQELLKEEER